MDGDGERYPQMNFLYYMMERIKEQIKVVDPTHAKEYNCIIDELWSYQMGRELYLASDKS